MSFPFKFAQIIYRFRSRCCSPEKYGNSISLSLSLLCTISFLCLVARNSHFPSFLFPCLLLLSQTVSHHLPAPCILYPCLLSPSFLSPPLSLSLVTNVASNVITRGPPFASPEAEGEEEEEEEEERRGKDEGFHTWIKKARGEAEKRGNKRGRRGGGIKGEGKGGQKMEHKTAPAALSLGSKQTAQQEKKPPFSSVRPSSVSRQSTSLVRLTKKTFFHILWRDLKAFCG